MGVDIRSPGSGASAGVGMTGLVDVSELATGGAGTSGDPWTGWETPLNAVAAGSLIFFPAGYFTQAAVIVIKAGWTIFGAGMGATIIQSSFAGNAFESTWTINQSNIVQFTMSDLHIKNTNGSNTGAGFVDLRGDLIVLERVKFTGFKHQCIFDSTEVFRVYDCDFQLPLTAGVWLVNLAERTASVTWETNQVVIRGCNFNVAASAGKYGIIDDGGINHDFGGNNFTGGGNAIRAAGVWGLKIEGSEFEGSAGYEIVLSNVTAVAGNATGACEGWRIGENYIQPASAVSAIQLATAVGKGEIANNAFSTSTTCIVGADVPTYLDEHGNSNQGAGAILAARPKGPGRGELAYAEITASTANITAETDVLTAPAITADGVRPIIITFDGLVQNDTALNGITARIKEGATVKKLINVFFPTGSVTEQCHAEIRFIPTAGAHTYKVTLQQNPAGNAVVAAGATFPAYIRVEEP